MQEKFLQRNSAVEQTSDRDKDLDILFKKRGVIHPSPTERLELSLTYQSFFDFGKSSS